MSDNARRRLGYSILEPAGFRRPRRGRGRIKAAAVAFAILVAASAAYAAYPVIDASHIAETQKVLSEAKKQLQKLADMYQTLEGIKSQVGGLSPGMLSPNNMASKLVSGITCLIPEAGNLRLPGGRDYSFFSACEAIEWLDDALYYDSKDPAIEWQQAKPADVQATIRSRREWFAKTATTESIALAKSQQKTVSEVTSHANQLISDANAETRLVEMMRIVVKSNAAILTELAQHRMIHSQHLQQSATENLRQQPILTELVDFPIAGGN